MEPEPTETEIQGDREAFWRYLVLALLPVTWIYVGVKSRQGDDYATLAAVIAVGVWLVGGVVAVIIFP